jgi:DNA gyrase subunit B
MKFSRGDITQEMKIIGVTDRTGTVVTFKPDPEMFDTLEYDYETLHTRMREQAFLNAGLKHITTATAAPEWSSRIPCATPAASVNLSAGTTATRRRSTRSHLYVRCEGRFHGGGGAMQYNDGYNETIVSFANDIHTPEGGMHEEGFKRALTTVLNAYGQKKGYHQGRGQGIRRGLPRGPDGDHLRQAHRRAV